LEEGHRRVKVTIVKDDVHIQGLTLGDLIGTLENLADVEVEIQVLPHP